MAAKVSKSYTMDMTSGSLAKQVLIFAIPLALSNLLQMLFNAADLVVVSRFAGDNCMAAVGANGPLVNMMVRAFTGISIGANVLAARERGAGAKEDLSRTVHTAMAMSLVGGLILIGIGLLGTDWILNVMDVPNNIRPLAASYLRIYMMGMPATLIYNFGSAILRAHGDSNRPMTILTVSGVINVVLNVILVAVFHIGVAGVAIATIAAQIVSAILVLKILLDPKEEYRMQLKNMRIYREEFLQLLRVGIPCGINSAVFCIANINSLGDIAMAGSAASGKISVLVYTIPNSIYAGCVSMAGQCYGAKEYKRIDELWVKSIVVSAGITAAISLFLTFFGEPVVSLFSSNPEVIREAIPKLLLFSWGYVLYAIVDCTIGCVRGMGFATTPTLLNIFCITAPRLLWNFFIFYICAVSIR